MERYSNSPGEDREEVWVKNPDIRRVSQTLSVAASLLMESSSITGRINPYRQSLWLLSTFRLSLLLVNLTPSLNNFKWKAQQHCRERKHNASLARCSLNTPLLCMKLSFCLLLVLEFVPLFTLWCGWEQSQCDTLGVPVCPPIVTKSILRNAFLGEQSPLHTVVSLAVQHILNSNHLRCVAG